ARPAGPWALLPQYWVGSSCLSFVSKREHHLLLRKTGDRELAEWLQAVLAAVIDEILRSEDGAAEAAGEFLKPRRQVYRGPDTSESEAIAAPDIAEQHVADMQRQAKTKRWAVVSRIQRGNIVAGSLARRERGGADRLKIALRADRKDRQ